ncbi:methyl-accepting chemotaxis protein, partial [Pseudomonas syringae]
VGIQRAGCGGSTLDNGGEDAAKVQRYAINFRGSVHDRSSALRDAVLVNTDQDLALHLAEMTRLEKDYVDSAVPMEQLFAKQNISAEERQLLRGIKESEQQTRGSTTSVIALRRAGDIAGAQALLLSQTSGDSSAWLKRINARIDQEDAWISGKQDSVQATA